MDNGITETIDLNLTYDVVLLQAGSNAIEMIAALQTVRDMDVAEADELLSVLPSTVLTGVPLAQARAAKQTLEEAGAMAELRLCR
jgi:ribosomal protein L7/L12